MLSLQFQKFFSKFVENFPRKMNLFRNKERATVNEEWGHELVCGGGGHGLA